MSSWFRSRYNRTKEGLEKVREAQKRGVAGRLERKKKFIGPQQFSSPQEKYRKTHPKRIAQIQKRWAQTHPEKVRENVRKQRLKHLTESEITQKVLREKARRLSKEDFTSQRIKLGSGRRISTGKLSRTWDKRIQERRERKERQLEKSKQYRSEHGYQKCLSCGRRMKPHIWRTQCKDCDPVRTVD